MHEIEWLNKALLLPVSIGVVCVVLGAFLGYFRRDRTAQQALHDEILAHNRTATLLENARATEEWLHADLADSKEETAQLSARLEANRSVAEEANQRLEVAYEKNRGLAQRLADSVEARQKEQESLQTLQREYQQLQNKWTELNTTLQQREKAFTEQKQQLTEARTALSKEFELLAQKVLDEKGKVFNHTSQRQLDHLLQPFRQQISSFQQRVNEVHNESVRGGSKLSAEIKKVLDVGLSMSEEATHLTRALKGDAQQRGAWGEAQLQRTLELSGLKQGEHFTVQDAFRDTDGRAKQTDAVVRLPGDKHLVIDSKITLNAYQRWVSADTQALQQAALRDHVAAVRRHIDDLASKEYALLPSLDTPSFVLLFMPIEAAFIEALKAQPELFEYGFQRGVVLVSHTTLIPVLRTVSNLWMIDRGSKEAREIGARAADIYNQVRVIAERLNQLGNSMAAASNHYNRTVTALVGQQGLYGKVERFDAVSTKVNQPLPEVPTKHLDLDNDRLALLLEEEE